MRATPLLLFHADPRDKTLPSQIVDWPYEMEPVVDKIAKEISSWQLGKSGGRSRAKNPFTAAKLRALLATLKNVQPAPDAVPSPSPARANQQAENLSFILEFMKALCEKSANGALLTELCSTIIEHLMPLVDEAPPDQLSAAVTTLANSGIGTIISMVRVWHSDEQLGSSLNGEQVLCQPGVKGAKRSGRQSDAATLAALQRPMWTYFCDLMVRQLIHCTAINVTIRAGWIGRSDCRACGGQPACTCRHHS